MRGESIIVALMCHAFLCVSTMASPTASTTHDEGIGKARGGEAAVDSVVNELARVFLKDSKAVGFSIGVFKDGNRHVYHYGEEEKGMRQRPTANTLYAIGSITKTFTATLVAQAVIEHRASLDDDIRKYIEGDYPNLEFEGQPIRLIHLLNHVSGLPNFLFDIPASPPPDYVRQKQLNYSREEFFGDLRQVALENAPGSKFQYSNASGQLLGYALERLYGMSYEELIKTKIAGPLGMNRTKITLLPSEVRRYKGYDENGSVVPDNPDQIQAAGAVKSTVVDMLNYAAWHLAEEDEAVRLTHQPTINLVENYWLGLNWQMFKLPRYRALWQEGSLPGFTSYCAIYPELDLAIVVLANEYDPDTSDKLTDMAKQITRSIDPRANDLP